MLYKHMAISESYNSRLHKQGR